MYYKIIKEKYKDTDELVEYLYNHYYYIVDKIYERNNKNKKKVSGVRKLPGEQL